MTLATVLSPTFFKLLRRSRDSRFSAEKTTYTADKKTEEREISICGRKGDDKFYETSPSMYYYS